MFGVLETSMNFSIFFTRPRSITFTTQRYFPAQDPKYRSLSTSSKVYQEVLAPHPPMLEVLRLAGFRPKDGDESHLTLLHRRVTASSTSISVCECGASIFALMFHLS